MTVEKRRELLLDILKRDKFTTKSKISYELAVSLRTIAKDVSILRNLGFDIKSIRGKYNGGIYLDGFY